MRVGNRWDGTLGGNNFRLKRGEGSYRKIFRRSEGIPFQENTENRGQFNTRGDTRQMFQTSWAEGALWNKPLISSASIRSYFTANGMDVTTVPGDMIPLGTVTTNTTQTATTYHPGSIIARGNSLYAVGAAATTNNTVRVWNGATWAIYGTEFPNAAKVPVAAFLDGTLGNFVALFEDGFVDYVTLTSAAAAAIKDIGTVYEGANAFMHNGRMFVYNGEILIEITTPYATAAQSTIVDDGLGVDLLNTVSTSAASNDRLIYKSRLAISTAEGIYYVKNVEQEGLPTAFIYRVDRTNDGIDIATPVATLPPGMIALDIGYHLGSLLISATSDVDLVFKNDLTSSVYPRVDIYHMTNGSLGSIGSPLGGESPDESPFRFAGTFGSKVYIGGQKRLWEYDAIAGGLHPLFDHFRSGIFGGTIGRVFATTDAAAARVLRAFDIENAYFDMETETGTDNDSQTRELESVYFDFNIPAEQKTITHVTLMTDTPTANETWTIQLATDDSAFATVATHVAANGGTLKQRLSTIKQGHRFRYKIIYATTAATTTPSRVKGVVFHAIQGVMVTQWALNLDGTEFRNVENIKQRPEEFLTWLETEAARDSIITYVDEYKETSSSHNVKVESVSIERSAPQEIDSVQIILTEDT